jgi:hypothetical protein
MRVCVKMLVCIGFVGCGSQSSTLTVDGTSAATTLTSEPLDSVVRSTVPSNATYREAVELSLRQSPLESFSQNYAQGRRETTSRVGKLISDCMLTYGFTYKEPSASKEPESPRNLLRSDSFGILSGANGYWSGYLDSGPAEIDDGTPRDPAQRAAFETAMNGGAGSLVIPITGPGGSDLGSFSPGSGCYAEAIAGTYGSAEVYAKYTGLKLAFQLAIRDAREGARSDPEVAAAALGWSECMRISGYDFPGVSDPVGMFGVAWGPDPRPTAREIEVATTDARCNEASRYSVLSALMQTALVIEWYNGHPDSFQEWINLQESILSSIQS